MSPPKHHAGVCLFAAILSALPTRAAERLDIDTLQEGQPLRVEDATPFDDGILVGAGLSNGSSEGDDGVLVQAGVAFGVRKGLELSGAWRGGYTDGAPDLDSARVGAQQLLFGGEGRPFSGSASAAFLTASGDRGFGGEAAAQITEEVRGVRLHQNLRWVVQDDTSDRTALGLGVDHTVGDERLLLAADLVWERFVGDAQNAFLAEAGANVRISEAFLLTATVGVNDFDGDTDPRFLLGLFGRQ